MTTGLLDSTRALLASRTDSLATIAAGADVGVHWLKKFAAGTYRHSPRLETVQKLHDYLATKRGQAA